MVGKDTHGHGMEAGKMGSFEPGVVADKVRTFGHGVVVGNGDPFGTAEVLQLKIDKCRMVDTDNFSQGTIVHSRVIGLTHLQKEKLYLNISNLYCFAL